MSVITMNLYVLIKEDFEKFLVIHFPPYLSSPTRSNTYSKILLPYLQLLILNVSLSQIPSPLISAIRHSATHRGPNKQQHRKSISREDLINAHRVGNVISARVRVTTV